MTDLTTLTLLLGRLGRLNEAAVNEVCARHGTTSAEIRVMSMLSHRPEGAASPSDIATFVVQTSGGLTATLRRLEAEGHIERGPDPDDGRGRLVALTAGGRAFHYLVLGAIVERTGAALGHHDLEPLDLAIRTLLAALEEAGGQPSSAGFVAGTVLEPVGDTVLDPSGIPS